jgi:hypothetical protein
MYTGLVPLLPVIVYCCQRAIVAVRLPDGRIGATLQSLCEALQLDRTGQLQRILRSKMLKRQLLLVPVMTEGGWQQMDVLVSWAIPIWLGGINLTRLSPEKEALVLAFQEQIVDVLDRSFAEHDADPAPSQPERPDAAPLSARQMMHAAIDAMYQEQEERFTGLENRQAQTETWQEAADQRLVIIEEMQEAMGEHLVETRGRLARLEEREQGGQGGPAPSAARPAHPAEGEVLSPQHIVQLTALARILRAQTGMPITKMREALAALFGVEDVSDIPDAGWEVVNEWFWQRRREG